jgi:hypothetical protein
MRTLLLPIFMALLASLARPLAAGQDSLALLDPQALARPGFESSLQVDAWERDRWSSLDSSRALSEKGTQYFPDADTQKGVDMDLWLRWQASLGQALELDLPWRFAEFSPYQWGTASTPQRNDPTVLRGDHMGDITLRWRGAASWGGSEARRAAVGANLVVVAPTGLGPYESPHPLAASGEGGWAFGGGASASQSLGALRFSQQASGLWRLGYAADIRALSPTAGLELPLGSDYVRPGPSLLAGLGMLGLLARDGWASYWLGSALRCQAQADWQVAGSSVAGTGSWDVDLMPEFKAEFGTAFTLDVGARVPLVLVNLPAPILMFEPCLRLDMGY